MRNYFGYQESKKIKAVNNLFPSIIYPENLYDVLLDCWCEYTCAPRLRKYWSPENPTVGQCSITSFIAQEIFGGHVMGIIRNDGSIHCYNVCGNIVFDLTSEQFDDEDLKYYDNPEQFREAHFSKQEKLQRYEYLKNKLLKKIS